MKKPRPAKNRQSGQQVAKMGLGRVELPTSRLSGDHAGAWNPTPQRYSIDRPRDLPGLQLSAAVDHRYLWVHARRSADYHGHAGGSDRPPAAAFDRCRGVWCRIRNRRLLDQPRDAPVIIADHSHPPKRPTRNRTLRGQGCLPSATPWTDSAGFPLSCLRSAAVSQTKLGAGRPEWSDSCSLVPPSLGRRFSTVLPNRVSGHISQRENALTSAA